MTNKLTEQELKSRTVEMWQRFNAGLTLTEVGQEFGLSRERVRQLLPGAIRKREYWKKWQAFIAKEIGKSIRDFVHKSTRHGKYTTYNLGCRCDRCKKANTDRHNNYYHRNKDHFKEYREKRKADPETAKKMNMTAREWAKRNKDKINKYYRDRRSADPEYRERINAINREYYQKRKLASISNK